MLMYDVCGLALVLVVLVLLDLVAVSVVVSSSCLDLSSCLGLRSD